MNYSLIFIFAVPIFVLGVAVGSFLNVWILRQEMGGKRRIRSVCLSCGRQLLGKDLFPIVSFVLLRGRCHFCKSKISWQYPLVEFFTGLLFVFSFFYAFKSGWSFFALWNWISLDVISATLVSIFVYDLRHKIIGNYEVFILSVMALLRLLVGHLLYGDISSINFLLDILAGPVSALPLFLIWLFSRGKWMGFGDSKLMLGLGWLLGWSLWFSAFALSFWIGAVVTLFLIFIGRFLPKFSFFRKFKLLNGRSEIPLGPFLITGALLCFFLDFNVFNVIFYFFL